LVAPWRNSRTCSRGSTCGRPSKPQTRIFSTSSGLKGGRIGSRTGTRERGAAPDVRGLASRIRHRDPSLPQRILESTAMRVDCDPEAELDAATAAEFRLITPLDQEWPETLDHAFARIDDRGSDQNSAVRGLAAAPFALWLRGNGNLRNLSR